MPATPTSQLLNASASSIEFMEAIKRQKRGRLKVYVGMAPGVGKTYRMLQEAHALKAAGVEVVIGVVETHQRPHTLALLHGIEQLSPRHIFYKGKKLEELDLELALLRRPEIILIDELAHENVPGSSHKKRWEDVMAIVNAGIHVITAVNIQHLESLADKVETITGIKIAERVPDSVLQNADEVVNVDLTVNELLTRLESGNIYALEKATDAKANFFQHDKLLQLRELALREVTKQVDRQIEDRLPATSTSKRNDSVVLCIGTNHVQGQKMIRKVARYISSDHNEWWVLHIQTEKDRPELMKLSTQRLLLQNLKLAQELGAKVKIVRANHFVEALTSFAKETHAGLVAMGISNAPWWSHLWQPSPMMQAIKQLKSLGTDVLLIGRYEH